MSKKCKGCSLWANEKNSPGYQEWLTNHVCQVNLSRSSGSMESTGIANMFKRSITKNNIRDTNYIGDGHSSIFNTIKESKPYGNTIITKLECVGHAEKHLGTRCQKLSVTWKGKKLSDEKDNMGAGCITDKAIDTLQNYYGMVGRNNVGYLYGMKKSVWATLFHNCDIGNEEERHPFCAFLCKSWCMRWSNKLTPGQKEYIKKLAIPLAIKSLLMPIFRDLSIETLLGKYPHGHTQNDNEATNSNTPACTQQFIADKHASFHLHSREN